MNTNQQVQERILELCSESEHGSWEFWSDVKTEETKDEIFQAITDLVIQKKIYPIEHASIADQSYKEVPLDSVRLRNELERSMNSDVDSNTFYWFLATSYGKEEDASSRNVHQ